MKRALGGWPRAVALGVLAPVLMLAGCSGPGNEGGTKRLSIATGGTRVFTTRTAAASRRG